MKICPTSLTILGLAIPVALAFGPAQKQLVYVDNVKSPRVKIVGNGGVWVPGESFEFKGKVQVDLFEERFKLNCEKATGKLIQANNKTDIDDVTLSGGVVAVKSSEAIVLTTTGNQATYNIDGESRNLKLQGNISLDVKSSGKEPSSWHVTGSSAAVNMMKAGEFLNSAKLEGPLVFTGVQLKTVNNKAQESKLKVKANSMTYASKDRFGSAEIRLIGDIEIVQEQGSDEAMITGAELLVLEINKDRQIIKIRFSSGGEDQQIKSVITRQSKGGA